MLPPKLTIGPTRALIADLDATLVDTHELMAQGHHATACHFLRQIGVDQQRLPDRITYTKHLHAAFGQPAGAMLAQVLSELYPTGTPEHDQVASFQESEMVNYLVAWQDSVAQELIKPEPGLAALMAQLGQQKISLGIVTNCQPYGAMRALSLGLAHCGLPGSDAQIYRQQEMAETARMQQLSHAIAAHWGIPALTMITAAQVSTPKPDPQGTLLALRHLGISPDQAAYLGDHPIDMQTAQRAGIALRLGVSTGTTSGADLQQAGARIVVDTLRQLHFSNTPIMATIPAQRSEEPTLAR